MSEQKSVLKRALDAIDTLTAQLAASEGRMREPIAVIGMSCRLPGGVTTPAEYWNLLRDGRSGITEIPADRWDVDAFYDPDPAAEGKSYTKHGGFLGSIDTFDAPFFGISPREAMTLDPQHRLLLECSWEALEDAGIAPDRLTNSATGVYVGITTSDYARLLRLGREDSDVYSASGTALNAAAGRISFALGLQGPAMAIDTACSSSLVAAHAATQALRAGECDLALVGGVNVIASPDAYVLFSKWGMIAPGAECRTFDAGANGFVRGEGCGVIVLKRLSDALRDGDRVAAVIRGSAVNQDGPSSGLSVPNGLAQAKVIRRALENAGLQPQAVGFVEAHGTGTTLGDPIEVEALGEVYGPGRSAETPLMLGSVKPSIGHLESAAGVAALMKLILTVQHGELPPQRNFSKPNERIDWDSIPVRVNDRLRRWEGARRIGAVSGFGFSGTNVHMVVESAPVQATNADGAASGESKMESTRRAVVLPISARTHAALLESAEHLATGLAGPDAPALADVARTLSTGRAQLAHRGIVVGSDLATVSTRLAEMATGATAAGTHVDSVQDRSAPRFAFLYTGQGAQYPGMGLALRDAYPVFRDALDRCDDISRSHGGPQLLEILRSGGAAINETGVTQPALFAVEYALTELFRSWGITPAAVLGHSVGEFTAACVAGVMSLEDAVALITERGRLMQSLPAGGGMLAVATDAETARQIATPWSSRVSLAALNGPRDVVLSGDTDALQEIVTALRAQNIDSKPLVVSHAFHSPRMEPILDAFAAAAGRVTLSPPRLPLVSNLSGKPDADAGGTPGYWRRHIREPVAYEASIRHLLGDGIRVFLEIGPRPVLLGMARRFATDEALTWIPTLRGRASEDEDALEALGTLFTVGARPDWEGVLAGVGRKVSLPTYPFQRRRHWISAAAGLSADAVTQSSQKTAAESPDDHPLLGRRVQSPLRQATFECVLDPGRRPILREHRVAGSVIVPAAAFMELGHAAGTRVLATDNVRLEQGYLRSALIVDGAPRDVQLVVSPEENGATFEVFSRAADGEEWTSHAGGRITHATPDQFGPPDAARAGCTAAVDVDAYQERMQAVGLEYGPSFRALHAAWRGDNEAFGELRLPAEDTFADRVTVHPGLLDAAFHLIGVALPETGEDLFYLPVGYEAVDIMARAGSAAQAHVTLRRTDAREMQADISVWTVDGAPVLRVRGLQVRPVTRAQFRAAVGGTRPHGLLHGVWRPATAATDATEADWIVIGDDAALSARVAGRLRQSGRVDIVQAGGDSSAAVAGALRSGSTRGVVDLRTLAMPAHDERAAPSGEFRNSAFDGTLALLRALATQPPASRARLVLPTLNAHAVHADDNVQPFSTLVWGVAATAAAEIGTLDIRVIDIGDIAADADVIADAALRTDNEVRLAVRGGVLYTQRLEPLTTHSGGQLDLPDGPYVVTMQDRGTLDGLGIQPAVRTGPGTDQVEIEVLASGVNFRDVLNLLDMYPGPAGPLGNECCGRVVAVGAGVDDVRIGDLVTCIAESTYASHVVADAAMTFRVPAALSAAQASAFPIAQLTAYYALHEIGGMRAADRVLIHAGAGGVGLAAIHLALAAGAEVYASAGSEQKRSYLRSIGVRHIFDSRVPAVASEIVSATGGHGMDIVLNSLTGAFIDESLRALAPGGRFLEIGLRELRTNEQVHALRDNVSYHALLLGDVCRTQPELVRRMYDTLCELLADGRIPPPLTRTFPVREAGAAFRFVATAKHIGRVAVTHPAAGMHIRPDAHYVVTGGLGALGLHVAEWLAQHGGGHITLVGRGAPGDTAAARIAAMRSNGTAVDVLQGDVTRGDFVIPRLAGRPLRGVIHAAGVVDDAALSGVNTERFADALKPKADGAMNLARLTQQDTLDFFVLFSSASAVLGSRGQAMYAGANAYLDGLAQRLRRQGRAATSINWGAWGGGGMAAAVDERTAREWAARGVSALSPDVALGMMGAAIGSGAAQVAALSVDWDRFLGAMPANARPALLSGLSSRPAARAAVRSSDAETQGSSTGSPSVRATLLALPARDRLGALTDRIRRETAAVMGAANPEDLELNAGLMEQGMDSLMSVELAGRLGRMLDVSLPTTFTFEFPTLNDLSRHLLSQVAPAERKPERVVEISVVHTDVQELSDLELEAELRRELEQAGF
jgi:acyl transferase domain-containing protein/acyl carrier protein